MKRKLVIIGGCGFIGLNVLDYLIKKLKYKFFVIDNLKGASSKKNLALLRKKFKNVSFIKKDASDYRFISNFIKKNKPNFVLGLHGQVAVTKSIKDPIYDLHSNFLSNFYTLESIRLYSPKTFFLSLSSNKVYGSKTKGLVSESFPLQFTSPYACSKGAADQYVLDYSKNYQINAVSLRLSCVYGQNQWGTEDQGWISWFINRIIYKKKIRIFGNGKQVRDILHVDDLSRLILMIMNHKKKCFGQAFNIGGGKFNQISLIGLIKKLEKILKIKSKITYHKSRYGDQAKFVNDLKKVKKYSNWEPKISIEKGLKKYLNWFMENNI